MTKNTTIWKKLTSAALNMLLVVCLFMALSSSVFAQSKALEDLRQAGEGTQLPSFDVTGQHADAPTEEGVSQIGSVGLYVLDTVKYVFGTIAFIMIILASIKLVTAGKEADDVINKQKENLKYSAMALIVVIIADPLVRKVFFGYEGEALTTETNAKQFAQEGVAQITGLINFAEIFVASIAVLVIVISGLLIMTTGGVNEEARTKYIKQIGYGVGGLVLVGLSELIVKGILFPNRGESLPDTTAARLTIQNLTNFATGFIAFLSIAVAIYGGYLYVGGAANEENTQKAKKVLMGALIGILVAMGAFAIVNTVLPPAEELATEQPTSGEL